MKTRNILFVCTVASVASAPTVQAEGGDKRPRGAFGVNRRVATPPGYTEISGAFAIDCQLPTHPNGSATDDGGTTDEYQGPHTDIPQFYMGSSYQDAQGTTPVTTDAGISWGYTTPNVNNVSDGDRRRNRSWRYFYRIEAPLNGAPTNAQCEIRVWNSSTRAPSAHGFNFSRPLNSILGHRIYEGDDPATSVVETAGQSSLTVRFWGTGNPTGDRILYGRRIGSDADLYTFRTTSVGSHAATATTLIVASAREFAMHTDAEVIVAGANRRISAVDYINNTITLVSPLGITLGPNAPISQQLDPAIAYESHPVAPWYAEVVPLYNATTIQQVRMRRIVAMTRAGTLANPVTDELDGSVIRCRFSGGMVKPRGQAAQQWLAAAVDQGTNDADEQAGTMTVQERRSTGYDARPNMPANSLAHWDATWRETPTSKWSLTPSSRTIVEFPSIIVAGGNAEARRNSPASHGATENGVNPTTGLAEVASRYRQETVHINLKRVARPVGEVLRFEAP